MLKAEKDARNSSAPQKYIQKMDDNRKELRNILGSHVMPQVRRVSVLNIQLRATLDQMRFSRCVVQKLLNEICSWKIYG